MGIVSRRRDGSLGFVFDGFLLSVEFWDVSGFYVSFGIVCLMGFWVYILGTCFYAVFFF